MEFARKQLEKYGWTDGKGLGKYENGIAEALKPKLKRSVTGIGHDPASEFNEHWWETLYDKAANNIHVKEKNGKTKRIKQEDNEFQITNSIWRLKKKTKKDKNSNKTDTQNNEYQDIFVKKSILTSGGAKAVNCDKADEIVEDNEPKDVFKMTDEQLFAACGGRTAHKGARHGLKALGKLARIEEQEAKMLLLSKYKGYSHNKNINNTNEKDDRNIEDSEIKVKIKNSINNNDPESTEINYVTEGIHKNKKKKPKDKDHVQLHENTTEVDKNHFLVTNKSSKIKIKENKKRSIKNLVINPETIEEINLSNSENESKVEISKHKKIIKKTDSIRIDTEMTEVKTYKKKRKNKDAAIVKNS